MEKEKIRNLDEIIKEIENCEYIDCHKDEIFDDYQYENILYYLKQLKKQKEINRKAVDYVRENSKKYYRDWGQDDCSTEIYLDEDEVFKLLEILEDKEV